MKLRYEDFEDPFPQEDSPDFMDRVSRNWENLRNNDIESEDCYALILHKKFKPNRNKVNKFYSFCLWLFLCLDRPWEKNWKLPISEKKYDQIYSVLNVLADSYPDLPDIQTIRKRVKKENFEEIVAFLPFRPMFMKIGETFRASKIYIQENFPYKELKLLHRFHELIKTERIITKREIMRRLKIERDYCEFLIKKAEEENIITLHQAPKNRLWIIYSD